MFKLLLVCLMIRWLQLYMIMEVIRMLASLGYFMTIQDGLVSIVLHIHSSFVLMKDFKYIPSIAALLAVG